MRTRDVGSGVSSTFQREGTAVVARSVISLADPAALDPDLTGAKASSLAKAMRAGLPVLDGFVITTELAAAIGAAGAVENLPSKPLEDLRAAWKVITNNGEVKLVVRSSSTAEDGDESSMAGMFSSFLDIDSWEGFIEAVDAVLESRKIIDVDRGTVAEAPIAVLVQPQLDAIRGGVLFGVDPVTGDVTKLSVVAVEGGPDMLVSGEVDGSHYVLNRRGRKLAGDDGPLTRHDRRALADLAITTERYFGGPQDVEWGIGPAGDLHLFQSRPVTVAGSKPSGPILGPGPVAETFPQELAPLEVDLWIEPLRSAIEHALKLTGTASARRLKASPIVTMVGGRAAVDLELFGIAPVRKGFWARLNPVPPARRMASAWRVGRIKAALSLLATGTIEKVDTNLAKVPSLAEVSDEKLLTIMERARGALVSLHGYEVLAGLLADEEDAATGAALGLRSLALARSEGFSTEQTIKDNPEVLALIPPSVSADRALPTTSSTTLDCDAPDRALGPREALRLRIRWVQELSARAAMEAGVRMQGLRRLNASEDVALLSLPELAAMLRHGVIPADLNTRRRPTSAPLPAAFRVTDEGHPVPVALSKDGNGARGAGGGRGMGRVHQGLEPAHGDVLVVRTLDPSLAPLLPTIGGLVAETGSVLSHLAILAREFGVPTVVAAHDALQRFPEGTVVVVDGSTGEVHEVSE